ncbi:MAG: class I SAM-dependent methyltransferase [Roseiflexaceae bacterium]|nr:class I SAM-dependent methyltransferase [Roseiflexaceae bacterium]
MQQKPEVFEQTDCPLCGGSAYRVFLRGPDLFMHVPGLFQLVRCTNCRLIYQNPRPSLSSMSRYYPDRYGAYESAETGLRGRIGLSGALTRRALGMRCRLIDHTIDTTPGNTRRLLDIGCASGLFLEAMQQQGWRVEGVEPDVASARGVSERLGIVVFAGPFEHASYPTGHFDAITLWDVLEHLHNPMASLHEIRRILRPGGALFIRVPNAASYGARICGRYWSGYDLPRHMSLFTPYTLAQALAQAGFRQAVRRYSSGSYIAALHSLRFGMDDGRVSAKRAAAIQRVLIHPLFRAMAWLPLRLADLLAGGSNLEVLVR